MSVLGKSTIVVWIIYCFFSCQHSGRFVLQKWIDGFCWLCLLGLNEVRWHDTSFFYCFYIDFRNYENLMAAMLWWFLLIIPSYIRSIPYYKQRFLIVLSSPSQMKHKLQLLWILLIFYCVKAIEAAWLRLI